MKFKLNPLTGEFDYTSDSANKEKLNPMTGEFNLVEWDGPFSQIFNPLTWTFNLSSWGGGGIIAEVTGNWYINLTNAVANHLMELKAYGWTEQRNLPSEYTQVEYIQGDWNSYIDTWMALTQDDDCEVVFSLYTSQYTKYIFGSRGSDASVNNIALFLGGSPDNRAVVDFNNSDYSLYRAWPQLLTTSSKYTAIINKNVRGIYEDWTAVVENTTVCPDTITTGNAIVFGAFSSYYFSGRIYSVKVAGKMNLIPCKDSNDVVWMYDTINWVFYDNDWTWTFTAWPNAVPTPDVPMDIVCNNWVLKLSPNLFNPNTTVSHKYINSSGNEVDSYTSTGWLNHTDYIKVKGGESYTLSVTNTDGGTNTIAFNWFDTNKTILSTRQTKSIVTSSYTFTNVAPVNAEYLIVNYIDGSNKQLEQSPTATPYIAYGITYTDWTTETISITGNLVDFNETRIDNNTWAAADKTKWFEVNADAYWKSVGNNLFTNANCFGVFVPCKKGQSISIDFFDYTPFYSRCFYCEVTADWKVNTEPDAYASWTALTQKTFTLTQDDSIGFVLEWYISSTQIRNYTKENYTVVNGTTPPTTYIPYFNGGTATAEMLLKVGDYADEQEILSWNITRKVGIKVLDWTENWENISGYINISKEDLGSNSTVMPSNSANIICSHFETKTGTFVDGVGIGGSYVNFKYDSLFTTLAQFQQFLADQYNAWTPVIVVYPLATPTTESVTGQTMNIPSWDSTIEITQASIDNLWLYAKYLQSN